MLVTLVGGAVNFVMMVRGCTEIYQGKNHGLSFIVKHSLYILMSGELISPDDKLIVIGIYSSRRKMEPDFVKRV